jgi:hypothetical protein
VCQVENTSQDDIFVQNVVVSSGRISHPADFPGVLQGEIPCGVQFVVLVFDDPKVVVSKFCTLRLDALLVCQE